MKATDVFCYHADVQAGIVLVLADEPQRSIFIASKALLPSSDEVLQLLLLLSQEITGNRAIHSPPGVVHFTENWLYIESHKTLQPLKDVTMEANK